MDSERLEPKKLKVSWTIEPAQDLDFMRERRPVLSWLYRRIDNTTRWAWAKRHPGKCYHCYCNWFIKRWLRKWPVEDVVNSELMDTMTHAITQEIDQMIIDELLAEYEKGTLA